MTVVSTLPQLHRSGLEHLIRLVLADDHPIVLDGLVHLFEAQAGFCILATAATGAQALELVREHRPDVVVLDIRMPDKSGLEVLRELQAERSTSRVVILTASESDDVLEAIRMGVEGVVLKDMATQLLIRCVRAVHAGNKWIEKTQATRALDALLSRQAGERALAQILTPREIEVARLIARGSSNKAVATKLAITEGTIKLHLHHIYEKLDLDGRMALARYLRANGLE